MPSTSSADRASSGLDLAALHARIAPVLAGLHFPARRWQAVAEADLYGCDGVTRGLVDRLPERVYGSFGELVAVLGAVLSGRSVPPPAVPGAGRPGVPPAHARRSGTVGVPGVPGAGTRAPAPGSIAARPRRAPDAPAPTT